MSSLQNFVAEGAMVQLESMDVMSGVQGRHGKVLPRFYDLPQGSADTWNNSSHDSESRSDLDLCTVQSWDR